MKSPLKLAKNKIADPNVESLDPWKILVVDDDPEVIAVSRMILAHVHFMERNILLLSAESAQEAKTILHQHQDIAIALLDVVMETEDAGLQLVKYIREDCNNQSIRIILRTGQPGQAPEMKVIVDYDINDYKSKSELTAQKLFTTVIAGLRSYRHIKALNTNRVGLEQVIRSSDNLFKVHSMREFSSGVLTQLSSYLGQDPEGILCFQRGSDEKLTSCEMGVIAAAGGFADCLNCEFGDACKHHHETDLVKQAFESKNSIFGEKITAIYIGENGTGATVALVKSRGRISDVDRQILHVFSKKISLGFQNVELLENLEEKVAERTRELAEKNEALNKAMATIKTISGMVPLCAWCNNQIRDEEGQWLKLEQYLTQHTDAQVTHSICPQCAGTLF